MRTDIGTPSHTRRFPAIVLACSLCVAIGSLILVGSASSQTPAKSASAPKVQATLAQLMRGILYPSSNVIFAAQGDITNLPAPPDPSTSTNPLTSSYGGWQAVENASLALTEAANLVVMPGRLCSNGKPVPVQNADFQKFAQGLRDAGLAAYAAAQTKSADKMGDAADVMTMACSNCHDVYRDKGEEKDRCQK